jgi:REP element-mobilizing transposase RayT
MSEEAYRSGAAFAVTIATARRHRFLAREEVARICVDALRESSQHCGARVFAYCFMPDHAHLLASVSEGSLIDFIREFKQLSAFRAKSLIGGQTLWQTRFFDRAVRSDDGVARARPLHSVEPRSRWFGRAHIGLPIPRFVRLARNALVGVSRPRPTFTSIQQVPHRACRLIPERRHTHESRNRPRSTLH